MDGTLVDTEPVGPATFLEQLSNHGVEPEETDYELFVKVWRRDGTNINEEYFLASMIAKYGINYNAKEYAAEFFKLYESNITTAKALPGVDSFLERVSKLQSLKLAVVTASKLSQVNAVLGQHNWTGYFDAIISEEDITQHKPDPGPFIAGIRKLGAINTETIVFEDSKNGAIAGKAAKCTVIGLRVGNVKEQDLNAADVILNTFDDVLVES